MSQTTRLDKIVSLKNKPVSAGIDLHSCSDDQLNRLTEMSKLTGTDRSMTSKDYLFLNQIKQDQSKKKSVGRFNF